MVDGKRGEDELNAAAHHYPTHSLSSVDDEANAAQPQTLTPKQFVCSKYEGFLIVSSATLVVLMALAAMTLAVISPKPETPNPKPDTRNPKTETRNPKSETRTPKPQNSKSESRNPKPETRNSKPESRNHSCSSCPWWQQVSQSVPIKHLKP